MNSTKKGIKKLLGGITALTMLSSLCMPVSAASVTTLGDLNNDGNVNLMDFMLMKQHLVGLKELDEQALLNADINNSGSVNIFDAILLSRTIINIGTTDKPVEEGATITLLGDTIETSSSYVKINGSVATITVPGNYTVTGTLNDGQLIVDVDKDDYPDGVVRSKIFVLISQEW